MTTASSNLFLEAPLMSYLFHPKEHQSLQMQLVRVSVIVRHKCILMNATSGNFLKYLLQLTQTPTWHSLMQVIPIIKSTWSGEGERQKLEVWIYNLYTISQ